MQIVLPLGLLVRVETADQDVVVPAVDRPGVDLGVVGLLAEVGLRPLAVEDLLCQHVGRGQVLSAVEESAGCDALDGRDGEGVLESVLGVLFRVDDVIVAMVEFPLVWPILFFFVAVSVTKPINGSIENLKTTLVRCLPKGWPWHTVRSRRKYPHREHPSPPDWLAP